MPQQRSRSSPQHGPSFDVINEKIDSLADTIGKLAEVVAEDRRTAIENTREIYAEMAGMRDRVGNAGRITWPLIVTTFSAALAFAAIVGGMGSFALNGTETRLQTEIRGHATRVDLIERRNATADELRVDAREKIAKVSEWQRLHESGSDLLTSKGDLKATRALLDKMLGQLATTEAEDRVAHAQVLELRGIVDRLAKEVSSIDTMGSRRWNSDKQPPAATEP